MMVDIIQKKLYTFVIYPRHTKNTKYKLKVISSVHSVNKNVVKFSVDYNQKKRIAQSKIKQNLISFSKIKNGETLLFRLYTMRLKKIFYVWYIKQ